MSLLVWLPLNGNLNNNGLGTVTMSGTPSYLNGKLNAQAYDLSKRCTFTVPEFVGLKTMSMAFWYLVNTDDNLSSDWVDLFGFKERQSDDSATGDFRFETCYGSSKNSVAIGQYSGKLLSSFGTITSQKGVWHHVCVTIDYENNICTCYSDGVKKSTKTHNGGWCLGNFWLGQANAINGALQDLRLYDHVLSVKEVKELAKGLCLHLPLDWGGNPNIIKNSYTWMNKNLGSASGSSSHTNRKVYWDDTAPSPWVFTDDLVSNAESTKTSGDWYSYGAQGVTLTNLVENEYYTYSFWARSTTGNNNGFAAGSICESQTKISDSGFGALTNAWRKHTVTFKFTRTDKLTCCFYCSVPVGATINFQVCGLKLEKGSVATPYIPHVEETIYATNNYENIYKEDDSGYNRATNALSAPINGGNSPRGLSCTYFDGSDDGISFVDEGLFNIIGSVNTISFWIKSDGETGARSVYFSNYDSGQHWSMAFEKTAGNLLRLYWNGSPDYNNSSFTLPDNEWIHVCVVRESATSTKFYKNGSLTNTYTTTCTAPTSAASLYYIGRDIRTGGTCYKGYMSDFRIYATALSADDVKELYQVGAQIDKSGNFYCGQLVEV